ncbi:hypothetical protein GGQ86_000565 [Xanthobacter flavus]|uniref:Uncharacterized protein n=1 Tax=Xanthobacter flavus TaxID=281 RepID=A0A9W6CMT3_XANFL|nr:hypothetical protein [Xanthobacter flavus]MDR6332118.1 hypothetical protein [Xanthobacter flavus]GLI22134.1 hypothetical protein XFLAVUS301_18080 [Xanthobacter flavus]
MLYPGEELTEAAGYPALVRFESGRPGLPVVVFVTGGGVLGRIAYGPPEGRAADFLCHWLHEDGFPSLVLSYPVDSGGVFDTAFPQFSITDWAEQSGEIIARYMDRNGLPANAIVLGWSMAGRIAEPLHAALRRKGKGIELFVAMAAASALPHTLPGLDHLKPAASGLAAIRGAYLDWLLHCLADQNGAAGHVVLDAEAFTREMTGDFPVGLAASAMRYRDGAFVPDPAGDAIEVGTAQYRAFPPLALMTHASALDARHALTDRSTWGVYITQQLCEGLVFSQPDKLAALPGQKWALLVEHVGHAALRLSATLPGNHMFSLGEKGARRTVQTLKRLRQTAADVAGEISHLMD